MSGATDRREDEQVPQFYGRIDEHFAEWQADARLWQVEFKVDHDRLGCENEARNTRCCTVHSRQEPLDDNFDMRQGKAENIQDNIFREQILLVALQKGTATDLDDKIRG